MPFVCAEPHGLLQAFLNLTQNSHRAVQEGGGDASLTSVFRHKSKKSWCGSTTPVLVFVSLKNCFNRFKARR